MFIKPVYVTMVTTQFDVINGDSECESGAAFDGRVASLTSQLFIRQGLFGTRGRHMGVCDNEV